MEGSYSMTKYYLRVRSTGMLDDQIEYMKRRTETIPNKINIHFYFHLNTCDDLVSKCQYTQRKKYPIIHPHPSKTHLNRLFKIIKNE